MRVVAVAMVKNERDVIGFTVAHLLNEGVDRVVIADNLSTDGTFEWLTECAKTHPDIAVIRDTERGYYQAQKMNALAASFAEEGDWVVPFDADELWHAEGGTLAEVLREADDADAFTAAPFVHVPTLTDDTTDTNPFTRIRHRMDTPEPFPKTCLRWNPGVRIEAGNHFATGVGHAVAGVVGVRHFQYRTLGQVNRKVHDGAAALRAANAPRTMGAHWHNLAALHPAQLHDWWVAYVTQPGLVDDPAPYAVCPR